MRREVRTTEDFWAGLDHALPSGSDPSWHAFAAHDLPTAVERFATEWELLPPLIAGRSDYRLLIAAGEVVAMSAIEAQLAQDGAVEMITITIDVAGLAD